MDTHGHALTGVRVQRVQKVQKVQRVVVSPSAMSFIECRSVARKHKVSIMRLPPAGHGHSERSEESRYAAALNHRPINTSRREGIAGASML
jgi:hypothetical protein